MERSGIQWAAKWQLAKKFFFILIKFLKKVGKVEFRSLIPLNFHLNTAFSFLFFFFSKLYVATQVNLLLFFLVFIIINFHFILTINKGKRIKIRRKEYVDLVRSEDKELDLDSIASNHVLSLFCSYFFDIPITFAVQLILTFNLSSLTKFPPLRILTLPPILWLKFMAFSVSPRSLPFSTLILFFLFVFYLLTSSCMNFAPFLFPAFPRLGCKHVSLSTLSPY